MNATLPSTRPTAFPFDLLSRYLPGCAGPPEAVARGRVRGECRASIRPRPRCGVDPAPPGTGCGHTAVLVCEKNCVFAYENGTLPVGPAARFCEKPGRMRCFESARRFGCSTSHDGSSARTPVGGCGTFFVRELNFHQPAVPISACPPGQWPMTPAARKG